MKNERLRVGLIGEHLAHSFSPQIHRELADYDYRLIELAPAELGDFLKKGDFHALNVTIPYKKDVIPYLTGLSDTAKRIGAVNTILRRLDGTLWGYNTDYFGFCHMLDVSGIEVNGKKAMVFGTGGASATVCAVLRDRGVSELVVISIENNTPETLAQHTGVVKEICRR